MALLDIEKLTLRFGGLTAVNQVDAEVPTGQIFSIIGPNGAGKTTVFNAVTGIYEPTSGRIRFQGHAMARPFHWTVAVTCVVVGLLTAVTALLLTANFDRLWWAVVNQNYTDPAARFPTEKAWQDLQAYFRGDLRMDPNPRSKTQPIKITSADGQTELRTVLGKRPQDKKIPAGDLAAHEVATREYRDDLETVLNWPAGQRQPTAEDGNWVLRAGDKVLALWPASDDDEREAAQRRLDTIAKVARGRITGRVMAFAAPLVGLVVGAAGAWVVWNRSRCTPDVIARYGLARTFQNIRLFQNMTVLENVLLGLDRSLRRGWLAAILRTPGWRREEDEARRKALELLNFFGLRDAAGSLAKNLPYGDQRRLEIARALATSPKLLLLDEPAAGMNPAESAELTELIRRIRVQGVTILLIEHHMKVVMQISDRIAVLDYGCKIAEGTPAEVRANPRVIEAYLGKEEIG